MNKRHQQFIEEYMANGMNGTQAYLSTYPNATDDTARANATKLLAKTHIKAEIERLQAETSKELNITKESLLKHLNDILESTKDDPKNKHNAIKSIEVLNKMLGFNEPNKTDITTNGESINQITWIEQKTYKDKENDGSIN